MFERFRAALAARRDPGLAGPPWLPADLVVARGYAEFAAAFAGASFAGGLYRTHDALSGPRAWAAVREGFPELAHRACPFGYDWLGRQFALDAERVENGQRLVLLIEPGTGESLEIPVSFEAFHEAELVDYADAALATEFFEALADKHPEWIPIARDACIGYRVPLFLGGQDVVDNLEVTDLDVYWSICGQLRLGALKLPPGTTISGVTGGQQS